MWGGAFRAPPTRRVFHRFRIRAARRAVSDDIRKVYAMFSPGPMQLIIVLLIALLLFGNRLPSVMRSLGKSVVEFKKGVNDVDSQVKGALKDADDKAKNSDSSEE